jgi:hypothetical protein
MEIIFELIFKLAFNLSSTMERAQFKEKYSNEIFPTLYLFTIAA